MKRKLILPIIASIISLVTTLVAVSFAWFSDADVSSINTLNVQIESVQGVEFSVDGSNWKHDITSTDIINAGGLIPSKFYPLTTPGTQDANGLLIFYDIAATVSGTRATMTAYDSSEVAAVPEETNGVITGWSGTGYQCYIVFDLYCHSVDSQHIIFDTGTSVSSNVATGAQLATRIAFLNLGSIDEAQYKSSVSNLTSKIGSNGSQATVYEPNAQWHASDAISQGLSSANGAIDAYYSVKVGLSGDNLLRIPANPLTATEKTNIANGLNYTLSYSVDGVIGDHTINCTSLQLINSVTYAGAYVTSASDAASGDYSAAINAGYYVTQTAAMPYTDIVAKPNTTKTLAITGAGYTKLRVYMWLDGQDGDCVIQTSGSKIIFNLVLTTKELVDVG